MYCTHPISHIGGHQLGPVHDYSAHRQRYYED